jgi:hypothetical protein
MAFDPSEWTTPKAAPKRAAAPAAKGFDPSEWEAKPASATPPGGGAPPPKPPTPASPPPPGEDSRSWREKIVDKIAGIGPQTKPDAEDSFWRGAQTGTTLGFSDRLAGIGGIIGDRIASSEHGLKPNPDAYKVSRDEVRDKEKAAVDAHPVANFAGNVAGGSAVSAAVAPAFAPLRILAPGKSVPGALPAIHRVIAGTAQPLAEGIAQGIASEKEINSAADVAAGAAKGAATTAVVGGAVHGLGRLIKEGIKSAPARKIGDFISEVLESEDGNAVSTKRLQMMSGPTGSDPKGQMFDLTHKEFPGLATIGRVSQKDSPVAIKMVTDTARDKVATRSVPAWEIASESETPLTKAQLLNRLGVHRNDVQSALNSGQRGNGQAIKGSELERDVIDDLKGQIDARWPGDPHKTKIPVKAISNWASENKSNVADKMGTVNATAAHQANELTVQIATRLKRDRLAEIALKSPEVASAVKTIGETDRQFSMLKRIENALESKKGRQDARIKPTQQAVIKTGIQSGSGALGYAVGHAMSQSADIGKTAAIGVGAVASLVAAKYGPKAGVWVNDYLLSPMAENIARGGTWADVAKTVGAIGVGAGVQSATLQRMYKALERDADKKLPTYPIGPAPGTSWDKPKP